MTLRRAIRRLLRILTALALVSIAAFWGMAQVGPHTRGFAKSPFRDLPLFANLSPKGAGELAREAMASVAADDAGKERAKLELTRLGGAALPHILPKLDALSPDGRARVALALTPLAEHMGVAEAGELAQAEEAILFWSRFWQDRAIDFRPPVVKRLVARIAERSLDLRREDVLHLDTYALEELIRALGEVRTLSDAQRVTRLCSVLERITTSSPRFGADQVLGDAVASCSSDATLASAQRTVERWQVFWIVHGSEYVPLDGARRIAAMVTETQYGKWFMLLLRARGGQTLGGQPIVALIGTRFVTTSVLLACLLSTALGLVAALRSRSLRPTRIGLESAIPILIAELPLLLSVAIAMELVFGMPGLFAAAGSALGAGDVNAWMALCLSIALITSLCVGLLDSILSAKAENGGALA